MKLVNTGIVNILHADKMPTHLHVYGYDGSVEKGTGNNWVINRNPETNLAADKKTNP